MRKLLAILVCSFVPGLLSAQQVYLHFKGTVTAVQGTGDSTLAAAQVGDAIEGFVVHDPSVFPVQFGDGATRLMIRAPWTDSLGLMRTRLQIADQPFDTEGYAYHLGFSLIANGAAPAVTQDQYSINDWSSPLDISDPSILVAPLRIFTLVARAPVASSLVQVPLSAYDVDLTAAATYEVSIVDGIGERLAPGSSVWAFNFDEPPNNDVERPAMQVSISIDSITRVTCENRIPWYDFGWPFPLHPVGCGVAHRPE